MTSDCIPHQVSRDRDGAALAKVLGLLHQTKDEQRLALQEAAREAAEVLLRDSPEVAKAHLARWLGGRNEYLKV